MRGPTPDAEELQLVEVDQSAEEEEEELPKNEVDQFMQLVQGVLVENELLKSHRTYHNAAKVFSDDNKVLHQRFMPSRLNPAVKQQRKALYKVRTLGGFAEPEVVHELDGDSPLRVSVAAKAMKGQKKGEVTGKTVQVLELHPLSAQQESLLKESSVAARNGQGALSRSPVANGRDTARGPSPVRAPHEAGHVQGIKSEVSAVLQLSPGSESRQLGWQVDASNTPELYARVGQGPLALIPKPLEGFSSS